MSKHTHPMRAFVCALAAFFSVLASPVWTSPSVGHFTVNTPVDSLGAGGGVVSLRDAITAANAGTSSVIDFDPTAFNPANGPYEINLTSALPDLNSGITITGPGARVITIQGQGFNTATPYRIFRVTAGQTVNITGLTISGGLAQGAPGEDAVNAGTPPTAGVNGVGGAIYNSGSLSVELCSFLGNYAAGGAGGKGAKGVAQNGAVGGSAFGGAIYSDGSNLNVSESTFSSNFATGGNGGEGATVNDNGSGSSGNGNVAGDGLGGAVYLASGNALLGNSTFTANAAKGGTGGNGGTPNFSGAENAGGTGGSALGGGICVVSNGSVSIENCTIAQNGANPGNGGTQVNFSDTTAEGSAHGGGVVSEAGACMVGNILVAGNTSTDAKTMAMSATDVSGTFAPVGFNLIGAEETGTNAFQNGVNGNMVGTVASPIDAKLDPAGALYQTATDPVPTLRLRKGSPAVDAGNDALSLGIDGRGDPRPVDLDNTLYPNAGDGSDIGAFEAQRLPDDAPVTMDQMVTGTAGTALSNQAVTATDGDNDSLTYAIVDGSMPAGLTFNSDGTITGTPAAAGMTTLTFKANDGLEDSNVSTLTITISEIPSIVVTTNQDVANSSDGLTSLREALAYVQNSGINMPVTFDPSLAGATITLNSSLGALGISENAKIDGSAAPGLVINGNGIQIFKIEGIGDPVNVTLQNLTLTGGFATDGGAVEVDAPSNAPSVALIGCTLSSNSAYNVGGAIVNSGGTITLTNCTLANNSTVEGGAIFVSSGSVTLYNCTVTSNQTSYMGGGIMVTNGTLTLGNTIVAGNTSSTAADLSGSVSSLGFNLIGNPTGATITGTTTGNLLNVSPGFDTNGLANNGGPTQTVALLAGSAAVDQGLAMNSVTTDQRGSVRPSDFPTVNNADGGDGSDIGAFELANPAQKIVVQQPAGTTVASGGTVDFGSVNLTMAQDLVFTIENTGGKELDLSGSPLVTISGMSADQFSVITQPAATIAAGASTTFTVRFTPSTLGMKEAGIAIPSNDGATPEFDINLTGTGIDTITQAPTLTTPASGSTVNNSIALSYTLPEEGTAGTVTLTFDDGANSPIVVTLPGANFSSQGAHSANLSASGNGIPDGTYTVTLSYQDALGNDPATAASTNVTVDTTAPIITPRFGSFSPLTVAVGSAIPDYAGQAVSDGGETITQAVMENGQAVTSFASPGEATVTLLATDEVGNIGSLSFTVEVRTTTVVSTVTVSTGGGLPPSSAPGAPPAHSKILDFYQPAIDEDGNVAYIALYKSDGNYGGAIYGGSDFVAKVGERVPGLDRGTYYALYGANIRGGNVGFTALLTGVPASQRSVIMNATPEEVHLVAQTGTVAPSDNGDPIAGSPTFISFQGYDFHGSDVAFQAKIAGPGVTAKNNSGIWIQSKSHTSLVLRTGDLLNDHTIKNIVSFTVGNGSSGQGRGWLNEDEGPHALALVFFTDGGEAIVNATVEAVNILSETGPEGPGLPSLIGGSFVSYGMPATNNNGNTVFRATVLEQNNVAAEPGSGPTPNTAAGTSTGVQGIFSNQPPKPQLQNLPVASPQAVSDSYFPIAIAGQSTGVNGTTFKVLKDPVLASDGGIAFPATIIGAGIRGVAANSLWWMPPEGDLQLLAQGGQQAGADLPAGAIWSSFQSLAIAANRGPIFRATLVVGKGGVTAANNIGVWAVDLQGAVRLLFRTGQKVNGKVVKSFQILHAASGTHGITRSFNDQEQVIWRATFADGTQGVITTIVP